jgi:hypothetical protein
MRCGPCFTKGSGDSTRKHRKNLQSRSPSVRSILVQAVSPLVPNDSMLANLEPFSKRRVS